MANMQRCVGVDTLIIMIIHPAAGDCAGGGDDDDDDDDDGIVYCHFQNATGPR